MINYFQKILIGAAMVITLGCGKRPEEAKPEPPPQPATQTQPAQNAPGKSGSGMGIVVEISTNRKFITLDHNDIPGIMEAMSMEYPVQAPELLNDIHVKDSVTFTLTKTPESQYMVTAINKK